MLEDLSFRQQVPQLLGRALSQSTYQEQPKEKGLFQVPLLERGARAEQTRQKKRHWSNSKSTCLVMSAHSSDRREWNVTGGGDPEERIWTIPSHSVFSKSRVQFFSPFLVNSSILWIQLLNSFWSR